MLKSAVLLPCYHNGATFMGGTPLDISGAVSPNSLALMVAVFAAAFFIEKINDFMKDSTF